MNEERLNANLVGVIEALRDLIHEVRDLSDLVRPIAEKLLESQDEGKVARALMGEPKRKMLREDFAALREGISKRNKIEAIKPIRSSTHMSLKDAKDLVDKYWEPPSESWKLLDLFEPVDRESLTVVDLTK